MDATQKDNNSTAKQVTTHIPNSKILNWEQMRQRRFIISLKFSLNQGRVQEGLWWAGGGVIELIAPWNFRRSKEKGDLYVVFPKIISQKSELVEYGRIPSDFSGHGLGFFISLLQYR